MKKTPIDLGTITAAIDAVRQELARLEQSIEQSKREREQLQNAPLCNNDVLAIMIRQLDRDAEAAPSRLEAAIGQIASRPLKQWDLSSGVPVLASGSSGDAAISVLRGLLAEPLKHALTAIMKARPESPEAGPPLVQRRQRIAELDAAIERDESNLTELREQAVRAGLRGA